MRPSLVLLPPQAAIEAAKQVGQDFWVGVEAAWRAAQAPPTPPPIPAPRPKPSQPPSQSSAFAAPPQQQQQQHVQQSDPRSSGLSAGAQTTAGCAPVPAVVVPQGLLSPDTQTQGAISSTPCSVRSNASHMTAPFAPLAGHLQRPHMGGGRDSLDPAGSMRRESSTNLSECSMLTTMTTASQWPCSHTLIGTPSGAFMGVGARAYMSDASAPIVVPELMDVGSSNGGPMGYSSGSHVLGRTCSALARALHQRASADRIVEDVESGEGTSSSGTEQQSSTEQQKPASAPMTAQQHAHHAAIARHRSRLSMSMQAVGSSPTDGPAQSVAPTSRADSNAAACNAAMAAGEDCEVMAYDQDQSAQGGAKGSSSDSMNGSPDVVINVGGGGSMQNLKQAEQQQHAAKWLKPRKASGFLKMLMAFFSIPVCANTANDATNSPRPSATNHGDKSSMPLPPSASMSGLQVSSTTPQLHFDGSSRGGGTGLTGPTVAHMVMKGWSRAPNVPSSELSMCQSH